MICNPYCRGYNAYGHLIHTPARTCDFSSTLVDWRCIAGCIHRRRIDHVDLNRWSPRPTVRVTSSSMQSLSLVKAGRYARDYVLRSVQSSPSLGLFVFWSYRSQVISKGARTVSDFREHSGALSQRVDRDQPHRSLNAGTSIF